MLPECWGTVAGRQGDVLCWVAARWCWWPVLVLGRVNVAGGGVACLVLARCCLWCWEVFVLLWCVGAWLDECCRW